jgi:ribonuclease D
MVKLMEKHGRAHWIEEEMEALHDPSLYVTRPEEAWQRIKFRATKRQQLGRLQALAAWRESLAQTENIPRGRVIKDEALISLASLSPESPQAMMQLRGFPQHLKKNWREQLWKLVEEIKDISAEDSPQITRAKQISHIAQARLDLLNLLLKNCAREADVTPKLVAEKAWVESLAEGERAPEHPLMHGWRYELFGKKAVALIEGKVQMSLDPRTGMLLISDS